MSATVAFVGLGNIGGRVVAHLVKAGHDVAVFDLNAAAVKAAVEAGAPVGGVRLRSGRGRWSRLPEPAHPCDRGVGGR